MEDSKHANGVLVSKPLQLGDHKVSANTWVKTRPINARPLFTGQGPQSMAPCLGGLAFVTFSQPSDGP
jgi:hypothetical protein